MRWRFRKDAVPDRPSEATLAREQAERELERVRAETPEYAALGESLRAIREANHLTELILAIPSRPPGRHRWTS